jgi:hypothetical protein
MVANQPAPTAGNLLAQPPMSFFAVENSRWDPSQLAATELLRLRVHFRAIACSLANNFDECHELAPQSGRNCTRVISVGVCGTELKVDRSRMPLMAIKETGEPNVEARIGCVCSIPDVHG